MKITEDIIYVGVDDHQIDLFEAQYYVPNGMSYNSYVILDDKVAILDSVDINFKDEWLGNIKNILNNKEPDYLIIHHMEPDHSASILAFKEIYPNTTIVSSPKSFKMMNNYFKKDFSDNRIIVDDKSILSLGKHTLTFFTAPMVHWPEVLMSYDNYDNVLFSADAFGKFGVLDCEEEWACEARRYYFGIVGKYGIQVQNILSKISGLPMRIICPLHGPVLKENLCYYINLYSTWSSYEPEDSEVLIVYSSIYGNTKLACERLAHELKVLGEEVHLIDLARSDIFECVEDAFRYDRLVLASVTYNNDIFPQMHMFIRALVERNYQNRTIAFVENGTWCPVSANIMRNMFCKCKNLNFIDNTITIDSALSDNNILKIKELAMMLKK